MSRVRGLPVVAALVCVWLAGGSVSAEVAGARTYVLAPAESSVSIHVGKTGLFSAFGHEHNVVAQRFTGKVSLPPSGVTGGKMSITFETRSLHVVPEGEPAGDPPKVQATMLGPEVLDAERYPSIRFEAQAVSAKQVAPDTFEINLAGTLELHGVVKRVRGTARAQLLQDRGIVATGKMRVKQTDFGIKPVTAGAGTVKVEDEVTIAYRFVGRAAR